MLTKFLVMSTSQREHVVFTPDRFLASTLYEGRRMVGEDVVLYECEGQDRRILKETPGYKAHRERVQA